MKKGVLTGILLLGLWQFGYSALKVTSPNGGESWALKSTKSIKWNHDNLGGNVIIRLIDGNQNITIGRIVNSTPNDGEYSWTIEKLVNGQSIAEGSYRIRIHHLEDPAHNDISDAPFDITSGSSPDPKKNRFLRKIDMPKTIAKPDLKLEPVLDLKMSKYGSSKFVFQVINNGPAAASNVELGVWLYAYNPEISLFSPEKSWHLYLNPIQPTKNETRTIYYSFAKPGKYSLRASCICSGESNYDDNEFRFDFEIQDAQDMPEFLVRLFR